MQASACLCVALIASYNECAPHELKRTDTTNTRNVGLLDSVGKQIIPNLGVARGGPTQLGSRTSDAFMLPHMCVYTCLRRCACVHSRVPAKIEYTTIFCVHTGFWSVLIKDITSLSEWPAEHPRTTSGGHFIEPLCVTERTQLNVCCAAKMLLNIVGGKKYKIPQTAREHNRRSQNEALWRLSQMNVDDQISISRCTGIL